MTGALEEQETLFSEILKLGERLKQDAQEWQQQLEEQSTLLGGIAAAWRQIQQTAGNVGRAAGDLLVAGVNQLSTAMADIVTHTKNW